MAGLLFTPRVVFCALALYLASEQSFAAPAEWPFYGGDAGGTKYSPLAEINKQNVHLLKPAWIFDPGDFSDGSHLTGRSAFENTPLVVDGVMYVSTSFHRLFALNPESGKVLWEFDPKFDRQTRVTLFQSRGVAFWRKNKAKRIFLADQQGRLFSVDAETGKPDLKFGANGSIDLKKGMVEHAPDAPYGLTSPVAVCEDTVVTGAWVSDGEPQGPSGDVRGFDAQTGKLLWRFHTVPHPGEFGHDTWAEGAWRNRGGTNVWSLMSVDAKRGTVFLPLTSPSTDFFGADRAGDNLFGDSVVALDCKTGKRKWHFQTVHHDLWDYDLPSQPVLVTLNKDGKPVDAVAQATKTGFVFVLDRETGKPLFDIEERPVPRSPIEGERSAATQPFPVKPPPFARQSMSMDELTTVTPESRAECLEMVKGANVHTKLYDPIGEQTTVMFPGTNGGSNWGGGSFDPHSGLFYVNSMDVGGFLRLVKRPAGSAVPYRTQGFGRFWDKNGYPCQEPPWGTLSAIDLNKGEIRWQVRLGEFEELTKRGVPKTGTPNLGGSIVTAGGLVFIGATNDSKFRAFDKDSGAELWTVDLPASAHATPISFTGPTSGKQYVVVAAGGGNKYNTSYISQLIAFRLPQPGDRSQPQLTSARQAPTFRADYQGKQEKLPISVAEQPIAFNHQLHSDNGIKCQECHSGATTQARATLPTSTKCAMCHVPKEANTAELRKLARMHKAKQDFDWVRVYKVPDFVFFSHERHAKAGTTCNACHGPVETRAVLAKEASTSMTACMSCHRKEKASLACNVCHELGQ
jgi:glucose dehydrogenase